MFIYSFALANLVGIAHADFELAPAEPAFPAPSACFSPGEACKDKILAYMNAATKTLDIAVYDINDLDYAKPIWTLSKRIKVRVLTDAIEGERPKSAIARMARSGVEVRYGQQPGLYHNNFVVRDQAAVETGSFNLTDHSARSNRENQIYVYDPGVVARYQKDFDDAWTSAKPWTPAEARGRGLKLSRHHRSPVDDELFVDASPAAEPVAETPAEPRAPASVAPKPRHQKKHRGAKAHHGSKTEASPTSTSGEW